jgi:hypothetical protein
MNAKKMMIRTLVVAALAAGAIGTASAAWQLPNGVWMGNLCVAPSGNWAYMQFALPVGYSCRIFPTGEYGLVE